MHGRLRALQQPVRLRLRAEDGRIRVDTQVRTRPHGPWRLTVLHERRIVRGVRVRVHPRGRGFEHRVVVPDYERRRRRVGIRAGRPGRRDLHRQRRRWPGRRTHVALGPRPPLGAPLSVRRRHPGATNRRSDHAQGNDALASAALAAGALATAPFGVGPPRRRRPRRRRPRRRPADRTAPPTCGSPAPARCRAPPSSS